MLFPVKPDLSLYFTDIIIFVKIYFSTTSHYTRFVDFMCIIYVVSGQKTNNKVCLYRLKFWMEDAYLSACLDISIYKILVFLVYCVLLVSYFL